MNAREEGKGKAEEMGSLSSESTGVDKNETLIDPSDLVNLFKSQQNYLNFFFQNLDSSQTLNFTQTLLNAKGKIFFTGVGKSGFVAQKISQTLTSLGIRSGFLSPVGDITILSKSDIIVIFCKSGNSGEILELVPYMKAKGVFLISVTSMKGNVLEGVCDLNVHLPLERELCPYNLTPVTSSAIQLIFGDTVAIALMGARSLKKDDHQVNHQPTDMILKNISSKDDSEANKEEDGLSKTVQLNDSDAEDGNDDHDEEDEDEANEEAGGLSKTGRRNGSDDSDDDSDDDDNTDDEIGLSLVPAPKRKSAVTVKHSDSRPSKTTAGSARGTPLIAKSVNDKRKSGTDGVKSSNGTPPAKKVKTKNESNLFANDGSASASKGGSVPTKIQPSAGSVMEDEIRTVLMQKSPVTLEDIVAKFKARIKGQKDRGAFLEALKKMTKIKKTNGSNFVVLRER